MTMAHYFNTRYLKYFPLFHLKPLEINKKYIQHIQHRLPSEQ